MYSPGVGSKTLTFQGASEICNECVEKGAVPVVSGVSCRHTESDVSVYFTALCLAPLGGTGRGPTTSAMQAELGKRAQQKGHKVKRIMMLSTSTSR